MNRKMSLTSCSIFNQYRLEGKFCDAVIKVDEIEMKVHKIIMVSCSSYFKALFSGAWSNKEKMVYNIPGVSADMMELIIEYAYIRTISITADNVKQLLIAADQFCVSGIVKTCCDFFESHLCPENSIGIWMLADCCYCPELKTKASLFILQNFEETVKASEEFLQLSAFKFGEIIEKDELSVKQEDVVFEAIVKWINHDPKDRKKFLPLLLPKVRLYRMDVEYFIKNIKNHDYVKGNHECNQAIINTLKIMYALNKSPSCQQSRKLLNRPRLPDAVLFAIGGESEASLTNVIEAYDTHVDMWVDVTSEGESPRANHGVAYLKGYMYIIGGTDGENYLNTVRCFNPIKKTWQEVAPMHSRHCCLSVTVLNNFIYAMGGFDGQKYLNTAEQYDPEMNRWTLISHMHEVRTDAGATALQGKVYIFGGSTGDEYECLQTAEIYDPETNQWALIAPMRNERRGAGVTAYQGNIYVVGGFDGFDQLSSVEVYNPVTNTWHIISNMLTPRSNFGIGVLDEQLFVVGGYNGFSATLKAECYNVKTGEWHNIPNMRTARSALKCCVIGGLPNTAEYAVPRKSFPELSLENKINLSDCIRILAT
ncbi:kelch-like protein 10 [Protopterus annectens]|uniref:kelch-like protein 10 n=1 Tax=Protopterus annectens TaxID=7888 RepID=UPI001CFC2459|nr:kelch-like protein 10 [Protopterus annectens]